MAVTNDYKLGSLEQHKHILLEFQRSEVHNQSHTPCRLSSLLFSSSKSCFLPSSKPTEQYMVSPSHHILLCSQISLCSQLSSSHGNTETAFRSPPQIIQDNLPISRVLILSSRSFKPGVGHSQVHGLEPGIYEQASPVAQW